MTRSALGPRSWGARRRRPALASSERTPIATALSRDKRPRTYPQIGEWARSCLLLGGRGSFSEKAILLVVYVGVISLIRGITELVLSLKPKGTRTRIAVA